MINYDSNINLNLKQKHERGKLILGIKEIYKPIIINVSINKKLYKIEIQKTPKLNQDQHK